jgi:hypothetical protein
MPATKQTVTIPLRLQLLIKSNVDVDLYSIALLMVLVVNAYQLAPERNESKIVLFKP